MEKINQNRIDQTTLEQRLSSAGIDYGKWGRGSKTVLDLLGEINGGESELVAIESGELIRVVKILTSEIYYLDEKGRRLVLREDRQVFKNGFERRRIGVGSVSGKMVKAEDPKTAMLREIKEELGVELVDSCIEEASEYEKTQNSLSYPGLKSRYFTYSFVIRMSDDVFKENGYVEHQEDKDTYFVWE